MDGYYGSLSQWGPTFVRSLSFESNKRTYGPFGVQQGRYFSLPVMPVGKIVGFHGRYGWHLDAIGVHLKSLQQPNPSKALTLSQNYMINTSEHGGYSVIQGSVGQGFDIVLALRQKDDFGKPLHNNSLGKISSSKESNDVEEPKEKVREREPS